MQKQPFSSMIAPVIRRGGVGVIPTDTIYGIVGSALQKKTVEKIYRLRRRNPKKPVIVLIASMADLKKFDVAKKIGPAEKKILQRAWPGKVSVILPCPSKKFVYLHRGTKGIAFRLPKPAWLRALLRATGPLVAPSANFEGAPPARTVREAKKYFGDKVDFYVDRGPLRGAPSALIQLSGEGRAEVLRGKFRLP